MKKTEVFRVLDITDIGEFPLTVKIKCWPEMFQDVLMFQCYDFATLLKLNCGFFRSLFVFCQSKAET